MAKLSAEKFEALIEDVRCIARDLSFCRDSEIEREALRLSIAVADLCHAELARHSERLIERRRSAIAYSSGVLARREPAQAA